VYAGIKTTIARWLARRLPPCRAVAPLVSQSFERSLSPRERLRVRAHLLICALCARYMKQLWLVRGAARARAGRMPSHCLPPEARERIRSAVARRNDS
jgi:hypothetical protein